MYAQYACNRNYAVLLYQSVGMYFVILVLLVYIIIIQILEKTNIVIISQNVLYVKKNWK